MISKVTPCEELASWDTFRGDVRVDGQPESDPDKRASECWFVRRRICVTAQLAYSLSCDGRETENWQMLITSGLTIDSIEVEIFR